MNILISCGFLNYSHDANTKIAAGTAKALTALGHNVSLAGECVEMPDAKAPAKEKGIAFYRFFLSPFVQKASYKLEKYVRREQFNNDRNLAKRKFMLTHPFSSAILSYRYSKLFTNERRMQKYANKILALSKDIKAECVICIYSPFQYAKPIFEKSHKFSIPLYVWQLDPWGLHHLSAMDTNIPDDERIAQEVKVFELAKHVFTTLILKKQYSENGKYAKLGSKISVLEFPNITKENLMLSGHTACAFKSDTVNMVFCGLISDLYRNPRYLLSSLVTLTEQGVKLKAAFIGGKSSISLDEYLKNYPGFFQHYAAVSVADAFATMKNADILINIGNALDNQVPSKIFDYFALGKPVLNVQKIDNCPAREYFERYPLAYTICETDEKLDIEALACFVKNAKGKKIEFSEVQAAFADCTPQFVAKQISDIINAL